jgi:hypothetical protein
MGVTPMSNTPVPVDIRSISSNKDLLRLAQEVSETNTPRALTKDDKTLAVLVPAGGETDIFTTLSENEAFLAEAAAAEEQLQANPASLPNLTEKYSYLIKPTK